MKAQIERCELSPSTIANTEVEGVYVTTLGRRSLSWLHSLQPQSVPQATDAAVLRVYDMLLYFTEGLVVSSEMGLYPYVCAFYSTGKALYEASQSAVLLDGEQSNTMPVEQGVAQGCNKVAAYISFSAVRSLVLGNGMVSPGCAYVACCMCMNSSAL